MAKSSLTSRSSAQDYLQSLAGRRNLVRALGIAVVLWGELGAFHYSLRDCQWPVVPNMKEGSEHVSHVLLLSDTQVKHPLLQAAGQSWSTSLRRFFYDLNLKKSWHVASRFHPDAIIFLGDMLSNGNQAKDEQSYAKASNKFKRLFGISGKVPTYYVPGNNDIAMGEITPVAKRLRGYFKDYFGPLSHTFDINNHTFVALDAPGLVDEDYQRAGRSVSFHKWTPIPNGADRVRQRSSSKGSENPMILLSHIPLARPEMANCGPFREKGTLRRDLGHGFQSMLGRETTGFLLKTLEPLAVFSGDNRDYCEFGHTSPSDAHSIREVTLKSFSMSSHIQYPGFQLLTIMNPSSRTLVDQMTVADTPCFLPDQTRIYTSFYGTCIVLTALALLIFNYRRLRRVKGKSRPVPIRVGSASSMSSGPSSPVRSKGLSALPYTPTWSALSPNTPSHNLPGVLRTPHSSTAFAGPSYRASSRPGTPSLAGSLAVPESPFAYAHPEDEEDPMQPSQYMMRRDSAQRRYDDHDEEWSDLGHGGRSKDGEDDEFDVVNEVVSDPAAAQEAILPTSSSQSKKHRRTFSEFISAPNAGGKRGGGGGGALTSQQGWSWTFVVRGRRRRITLRVPNVAALQNLVSLFQSSGSGGFQKRGQSVWLNTLVDLVSVSWPAIVMWFFIVWCLS
ncbi:hypothetical protein BKA70DRAFT_1421118 [Coprinopsis sp. MPI-PUGE-AT-0042]|nr:hypothetical protein BKA70DRAFT_1421118 [Coprinopsis sp. MPI-PUGE-AT-0042]